MHVMQTRNVHEALPEAIRQLQIIGQPRESRYGDVLVSPDPVTTVYNRPRERVIFHPLRDANPFHNFFEGLWMLAGRNDVAYPARFAPRMTTFSDDGETLHGAYGYRWRRHWHASVDDTHVHRVDQLSEIISALKDNADDRRQILQMWDPSIDLIGQKDKKDIPCNVAVHFQINMQGELDMTVFCRSNDIVWGCYGSDAVHFSMLQEYVASGLGCPLGRYWQISDNWHAYVDTLEPLKTLGGRVNDPLVPVKFHHPNPYETLRPFPMVNGPLEQWDSDLAMFLDEGGAAMGYRDRFFRKVALPMLRAHEAFKDTGDGNRHDIALRALEHCEAADWRRAAEEWILRRYAKYKERIDRESEDE